MKLSILKCYVVSCLAGLTVSCHAAKPPAPSLVPPKPLREFRGAWIATVSNIDWPSRPGLPVSQQQAELIAIMDKAAAIKLNALILQVRPAADAFYASKLEPWSEYLTGQMGSAPQPFYDPLGFAVQEAHRRGLELHAWFNPFRARHSSGKSSVAPNHVTRVRSSAVRKYGSLLWLEPTDLAAQEHALAVILDVVRRYDIDGVHIDDYFYPYPIKDQKKKVIDFPDDASFNRYRSGGGKLDRASWRRHHVDFFVENLYRRVKREKAWVKVGISPFGIWRPGFPKGIVGLDAYAELHADARKWLSLGWADYFAPQLYWSIKSPGQSYPVLLQWWSEQNVRQVHLWPGSKTSQVPAEWPAAEIAEQINLSRRQTGVSGHIHYSVSRLVQNSGGLSDLLARQVYAEPALIPSSPWLDQQPPGKPKVSLDKRSDSQTVHLSWLAPASEGIRWWLLQTRQGSQWTTEILASSETKRHWTPGSPNFPEAVAVTAVDRCGNTGPPEIVSLH